MHRTQSDFDDNLTFKVFIFQFINFYSSIIYIAFFKGKFVGYPGAYINIVGNLRNEDVSNNFQDQNLTEKLALWTSNSDYCDNFDVHTGYKKDCYDRGDRYLWVNIKFKTFQK